MTVTDDSRVDIAGESDLVLARKVVREAASAIGFGVTDVTRIVTAASELTRNMYLYAGSGSATWRRVRDGAREGLEVVFADRGPGIANIEQAMQPGFTTSKGLGMGLPGAKRLMDEMTIVSAPGAGTTVTIRKWLRPSR
jgi:serine/threonine-protein kinase RsbT